MTQYSIFLKEHGKATAMSFAALVLSVFFFGFSDALFAQNPAPNVYNGLSTITSATSSATWGTSFGWVSLNSCNNTPCQNPTFGVNLDENSGLLTGQGWSNFLGWVTFDQNVIDPDSGDQIGASVCGSQAKLSSDGVNFEGWARATVATTSPTGFWNGCISMSGTTSSGDSYGVTFDPATGDISGSAWGSWLIGWLNFAAHTVVENNPYIQFQANPASIFAGGSSNLEWVTDNITSCTPTTSSPTDPTWLGQSILPIDQGSVSTGNLSETTTYEMDCIDTTETHHIVTAQVIVSTEPIVLTANPNPALIDLSDGSYSSVLTWNSAQTYNGCNLYKTDQNGNTIGGAIVTGYSSPNFNLPVQVNIPTNPTYFMVECTSSNNVSVYETASETVLQQPITPNVQIESGECVVNSGDLTWLAWQITDIDPNTCSVDVSGGGLNPSSYPSPLPAGYGPVNEALGGATYTLTCDNPLYPGDPQNQPPFRTDQTVVQIGAPIQCTPVNPPNPPTDPDIIFVEF